MPTQGVYSSRVHRVARWISDLANPLFVPPIVFIVIGVLNNISTAELGWLTLLSLCFYTFIPLVTALALLKSGHIESLDIPRRESRNLLYLLGIASAAVGSLALGIFFYPHRPFLTLISGIFCINPVIGYLLNRRWKVSIHSASISSGGIILLFFYLWELGITQSTAIVFSLILLLIILPVMMWSRFYLEVHTMPELIGGATAGIFFTTVEILLTFYFWQPL
ncbi:hypothetical protein NC796_13090 [Aliifodinibius sp. S!AR15-10]|uniref:hypothetical protein n=1 Tax=Aliifodinibius sp. S!AR15-10 TaxID=2950437 RepID=UPI00285CC7D8|nr:hypothetical protein [Aliifodinibius sp. S!AR15-10]MDR8392083.1 hypothetical protein [Aliifodinibius sp. S!AR15-10]